MSDTTGRTSCSRNALLRAWVDDSLLTAERFEKVRSLYVVLPTGRGDLFWWNWLLWPESRWGDTMPRQVPNRSMQWRRPTYEEAVERQQAFEERDDWTRLHAQYQQGWRSNYGRPEAATRALLTNVTYQPLPDPEETDR